MKRRLAIMAVCALTMLAVVPASADAHRLGRYSASLSAWLALDSYADNRLPSEAIGLVDLEWYNCDRITRHKVVCHGTVEVTEFYDYETYEYNCYADVSVRYPFRYSYAERIRVRNWYCDG